MESIQETYSRRERQYSLQEDKYHNICRIFSWLRLIAFIGILLSIYVALSSVPASKGVIMALAFTGSMGFLVYFNHRFTLKRDYFKTLVQLCRNELLALDYQFLEFPAFPELQDPDHPYASDLDIFGTGSAFQYLNRTVTQMGRQQLAIWLKVPSLDPEEILDRQESCRELSEALDWRLEFSATGTSTFGNHESLLLWLKIPPVFKNHERWIRLIYLAQAFMGLLTLTVIAGWVNYTLLVLFGLINLGILGIFLKKISRISRVLEKTNLLLRNYSGLFHLLKDSPFKSGWIQRRILSLQEETGAMKEIRLLEKLMNRFDRRNNMLIGFFRNALFLSDLAIVLELERWSIRNSGKLEEWLSILGEVDALSSMANFAHNNPSFTYPVPVDGNFELQAGNLGHPLIPPAERINNDFSLDDWHSIVVLTGANMAGKSTFLRTVGINLVLAHTGSPVCATAFRFKPCSLMSSIRTNDSLIRHESYFYAELKKLKSIVDSLEEGNELFILLDEVLKGTNSKDKLNGSITLVKKLLQYPCSGIIATHDLSLGELEKEMPANVQNFCFEADISNDQLSFDYRLRKGAAKNMTALFLMKKMNIV